MKKNRKAFTLIELIIFMALLSVVIAAAYSLLQFSNVSFSMSVTEYNEQAAIRLALEKVNSTIRYSSALFTIPGTSFRQGNLTANWNYIGIENVVVTPPANGNPAVMGSQIVQYTYDTVNETHIATILIPARAGVTYKFLFKKINSADTDNLLQFTVEAFTNGSSNPNITITSELAALNALQVVDFGTSINQAVAIAYRTDERTKNVVGHVAMVLDTSGSMAWTLSGQVIGGGGGGGGTSRIQILKTEATKLINGFAQEDNIDIALVPFSTSANNPFSFKNSRTQTQTLLNNLNSFQAVGGTNTGDGIRRAYQALQSYIPPNGVKASNYMIILVDGVTTFASVFSNSNRDYYTGTGNVNEGYLDRNDPFNINGQIVGNGSNLDPKGTAYVNLIGSLVKSNNFAKVYVIGFSSLSADLGSVSDIANACGASVDNVFRAGSSEDLNRVLSEIGQDIVNDLWYLQGPDL